MSTRSYLASSLLLGLFFISALVGYVRTEIRFARKACEDKGGYLFYSHNLTPICVRKESLIETNPEKCADPDPDFGCWRPDGYKK